MDVKKGTHQTGRHEPPSVIPGEIDQLHNGERETASVISVEQLQRLVQLLDRSDVSELEFKRPEEGTRLVLRKMKPSENNGQQEGTAFAPQIKVSTVENPSIVSNSRPSETRHHITSHLVGVFHAWAKPRGGALVAVGDHVNAGQLVATIESLHVINEVESTITGRVVEILVHEGQSVEYGQKLMIIDSSTEEEGQ